MEKQPAKSKSLQVMKKSDPEIGSWLQQRKGGQMTDDMGFKAGRRKENSPEEQGGYLPYRYVSGVGENWASTWPGILGLFMDTNSTETKGITWFDLWVSEQLMVVRLQWQTAGEWVGSQVSSSLLLMETQNMGEGTEGLYYVHKITVLCSWLENHIKCICIFMYVDVFIQ